MHLFSLFPDLYRFVRPVLFLMDPEKAHELAIAAIKRGLMPHLGNGGDPILHTKVAELDFPNPIGLAAGFDKNAEVMGEMLGLGFGFVEVGSITPKPQPGNPRPRLFRIPQADAVINRFGFNSAGFADCMMRVAAYRDANNRQVRGIIGINIGKNKDTVDAASDYVKGIKKFKPYADYLTVNISSPNTPGLRDLQGDPLTDLLRQVVAARGTDLTRPIFVKIAPDLTPPQLEEIAKVVMESGVTGIIVSNTTVSRPPSIPATVAAETGGLSGKPLFDMSTRVLSDMYRLTGGKLPLIGVGGVSCGADAYAKIRAGASLVQLYSALVYQGPYMIPRLNRELAALLKRDGFASVADAVGVDVK